MNSNLIITFTLDKLEMQKLLGGKIMDKYISITINVHIEKSTFIRLSEWIEKSNDNPLSKRWNGYLLSAIDGSAMALPETEELSIFGTIGEKSTSLTVRGLIRLDIQNHVYRKLSRVRTLSLL